MALIAAVALLSLVGCQNATPPAGGGSSKPVAAASHGPAVGGAHAADPAHDHEAGHEHAEKGPHEGTLLALGDDAAHLELVLDGETGKLTAYILDGDAEKPVAIKQATLELAFSLEHADAKSGKTELPESYPLTLTAVGDADAGGASEFAGQSDQLKGATEFEAALEVITVAGKEFKGIKVKFPEGNEHEHHHHHHKH